MLSNKLVLLLIIVGIFFSSNILYATKPDAHIEIIEERNFIVDLYLIDLSLTEDSKIKGAHFIWIPSEGIEGCIGKSYKDCDK